MTVSSHRPLVTWEHYKNDHHSKEESVELVNITSCLNGAKSVSLLVHNMGMCPYPCCCIILDYSLRWCNCIGLSGHVTNEFRSTEDSSYFRYKRDGIEFGYYKYRNQCIWHWICDTYNPSETGWPYFDERYRLQFNLAVPRWSEGVGVDKRDNKYFALA